MIGGPATNTRTEREKHFKYRAHKSEIRDSFVLEIVVLEGCVTEREGARFKEKKKYSIDSLINLTKMFQTSRRANSW